jgi:hypothetical protein
LVDASDIWRAQPDLSAYCDEEFHEITRDRVVERRRLWLPKSHTWPGRSRSHHHRPVGQ